MANTTSIIYDRLDYNFNTVPDYLNWKIEKVHADAYSMGPREDDAGKSKNHWVLVLQCTGGFVRVNLQSDYREDCSDPGVLQLEVIQWPNGISRSMVYRQSYTLRVPSVTVKDLLQDFLNGSLHKFVMIETAGGHYKGCRHHLSLELQALIHQNWIRSRSDDGTGHEDYLNRSYTRTANGLAIKASPIDKGKFLSGNGDRAHAHGKHGITVTRHGGTATRREPSQAAAKRYGANAVRHEPSLITATPQRPSLPTAKRYGATATRHEPSIAVVTPKRPSLPGTKQQGPTIVTSARPGSSLGSARRQEPSPATAPRQGPSLPLTMRPKPTVTTAARKGSSLPTATRQEPPLARTSPHWLKQSTIKRSTRGMIIHDEDAGKDRTVSKSQWGHYYYEDSKGNSVKIPA